MKADPRLDEWLAEGLITDEQAEAIRSYERSKLAARPRKLPLAAEALGYLGGSLAIIAAGIIVAQYWAELETWARLSMIAFASALLLGAGAVVRSSPEPALVRLTSFLWFLSAGGFAFFAGLVAHDVGRWDPETIAIVVGVSLALYAGSLWSIRRTALQQIAMASGSAVTVVALLLQLTSPAEDWIGLGVWGLGTVWALNAWGGLLRPTAVAYGIGSVLVLGGAQAFGAGSLRGWGIALGLVTAVTLMGASAVARTQVLLGFGAAGLFLFVPQGVFHWFGDTLGAPVALLVVGVALIWAAAVISQLRQRVQVPGALP